MLYEPPKTKKYIAIGAAALFALALVFLGVQKMNPKQTGETSPTANEQKTSEQQKEEIIKSLNGKNVPTQNNSAAQQEIIQKNNEETLNAVEKSNPITDSIPKEVLDQKSQEILNAMGAANPSKK
jgi:hypothetical protein